MVRKKNVETCFFSSLNKKYGSILSQIYLTDVQI